MKPKDNIEHLFDELKNDWDVEEPQKGHEARFLNKLEKQQKVVALPKRKSRALVWKALSIAASLAILVAIGAKLFYEPSPVVEHVKEPTEIEKTEFYFSSLINEEMEKIQAEATPETKQMIDDAMLQIKKLETDYKELETDLANDGNSKQILNAMIINFQTRINLLQDVLSQIEEVKQIKTSNNESQII
ncbi:hypothetical protein [Galbibacter sp. PAP.153]|uniref:hypothetical protein n=1 Tax=Galbibacter sp. PAP.153 TaxID=3104623 RepID=UPI00300A892B